MSAVGAAFEMLWVKRPLERTVGRPEMASAARPLRPWTVCWTKRDTCSPFGGWRCGGASNQIKAIPAG